MKLIDKASLMLLAAGSLFLIIGVPIYYFKTKQEVFFYQFNGKVETIKYSDKGEPTVVVSGKAYTLPVNFWNFNHRIEDGDSLIKLKNSMIISIIKKNGKVILIK